MILFNVSFLIYQFRALLCNPFGYYHAYSLRINQPIVITKEIFVKHLQESLPICSGICYHFANWRMEGECMHNAKYLVVIVTFNVGLYAAASDESKKKALALVQNNSGSNIVVTYNYDCTLLNEDGSEKVETKVVAQVVPKGSTVSLGLLKKIRAIKYNIYGQYKKSIAGSDVKVNLGALQKVLDTGGHPTIIVSTSWAYQYVTKVESIPHDAKRLLSMFPRVYKQLDYVSQALAQLGKESVEQIADELGNIATKEESYLILGIPKPSSRSKTEMHDLVQAVYQAKLDTLNSKWFNNASGEEMNEMLRAVSREIIELARTNLSKTGELRELGIDKR